MFKRVIIFGIFCRLFLPLCLNEIKPSYGTIGFHNRNMKAPNNIILRFDSNGGRGAGGGGRGQTGPAPLQWLDNTSPSSNETRGSNDSGKYLLMYGVPLAMWIRARLGIGQKVFESHRIHIYFF